jgi:ribosomal protein S18 acetylase RimI-like enzyme
VPSLLITPLAITHAREAARLHIQGQPGTFLTALGEDVLTVIYRALPQSRDGFGYAAVRSPAPHEEFPRPAAGAALGGYISATRGIGGLFVEMGSKRLGELLPPLLHRYRQEPQLALRSVQTALYPLLMHEGEGHELTAELLSIMVESPLRSHGVGALLMAAFLQECRNRGLTAASVTVDAANAGAQRFYQRHGFETWREIKLYGRNMIIYRRSIASLT